jgi:hypothetical protein
LLLGGLMPTIGIPEMRAPVLKAPVCPDCGKPMRLEGSAPNLMFAKVDEVKYVCVCGQTTERLVGRR